MSDTTQRFEADTSTIKPSLDMVCDMMANGIYPEVSMRMAQAMKHDGTIVNYFWIQVEVTGAEQIQLEE